MNRIERAKRGIPSSGKIPFGRIWVWDDPKTRQSGHWEIDKKKQAMIVDCATRYLAGESIRELAKEYGLKRLRLHHALTRDPGDKWQIKFAVKSLNIFQTVPLQIPRLLDDKVIAAIQERIERNRCSYHGKVVNPFVFSGMIFCAHCGYSLEGQTYRDYHYYRHTGKDYEKRACPGPDPKSYVKASEIENRVMRHLFDTFGNPAAVKRAIEEATPNDAGIAEKQKRLERLTEDLTKLERSRQRILGLVVEETIADASAKTQLEKLKEREQLLTAEQMRLKDELAHVPSKESIRVAAKEITLRFKAAAKARLANASFEEMAFEEKRAMCQAVFGGQGMGIFVAWDETGKKWRYRLEGHFIEEGDFVGVYAKQSPAIPPSSSRPG